jgi:Flp pilus assembly protein TadG
MRDRARGLAHDEGGLAALEFALIAGALAMVILATLEFGRALAARNEMSYALGRVSREVNLDPTTTTETIVDQLESHLARYDTAALDVEITEVSGTSFMEISVRFPFRTVLPFVPGQELVLNVSTLAPMVSPTQTAP